MDASNMRRALSILCLTPLFGSAVSAQPIDQPVARPAPIYASAGWPEPGIIDLRPLQRPCWNGSRWYGPYGYICYRTRTTRQGFPVDVARIGY
ncbi:hypothetical protein FV232_07770 [Methylobacterium sp. WL30]|jgi:hypothetical protein|uniref:hypothetical protein n=1 Tax=unclassified Methylobacterium TaxID=2615210 RepID=UPI0011CA7B19|nr:MULTISPECIES: hypothetical protein [unclassified Methylobacterium]TXN41948.1 hypothetical protein FV225_00685 [Methylobacterium sp. WL93]TXN51967.1 hypothetical protein FV227_05325 [Methylobacterium sp. WL119]TXN68817.1 hypothetical protein FV232_07770 [Methylobacterium sp. WL30]